MSLQKHKQEWDELGEMDPYWAILSDPAQQYRRWDPDAFFASGEQVISRLMAYAAKLGYPHQRQAALDFGCGLGRLTRALATHFEQAYGVDISTSMIIQARELHQHVDNLHFVENPHPNLPQFQDESFDLVCTFLVLQHIPTPEGIKTYIAEFVRTLKQGGLLVFQLITYIPVRYRIQPGRRLYSLLGSLGVDRSLLYERFGLTPIRMTYVPEKEVCAFLESVGVRILEVRVDESSEPSIHSRTFYVTK
jgi:SAM-dependent methyltransferase